MAEGLGLSELFSHGWEVQKRVESGSLSSSNKEEIEDGIHHLEDATRMATELSLFSRNEQLDEVATNDLKYLLLPALLGDLVSQLMDGDRLDILHRAKVYLTDYLQRCDDYSITKKCSAQPDAVEQPSSRTRGGEGGGMSFTKLAAEREQKIARLKAKREAEKKLKSLGDQLSTATATGNVDEELVRTNTKALLELWVLKARELLDSIDQESDLLEKMKEMSGGRLPDPSQPPPAPHRTSNGPLKPFVITQEMLRAKLLGAGYPSLPTMSLEEFYQKEYSEQVAQAAQSKQQQQQRKADEEEERSDDDDDEVALRKARQFDEYKDDHRRGSGNRHGKG